MKLSVSNIAFSQADDELMYDFIMKSGFNALEIAPTRLFAESPYDRISDAIQFSEDLEQNYGLSVSSMQSIWYGRNENIFSTDADRKVLIDYTKKAIDFAFAVGCKNLVFGCPKNRNIDDIEKYGIAVDFFKTIGDYAESKNTVIAIEPNPPIYNTNFINKTEEAFELAENIASKGIAVNIDLGTIIHNGESLDIVEQKLNFVNHIHISEPYLELIQERGLHKQLADILIRNSYDKYVSIEMKNLDSIELVKKTILYVGGLFS